MERSSYEKSSFFCAAKTISMYISTYGCMNVVGNGVIALQPYLDAIISSLWQRFCVWNLIYCIISDLKSTAQPFRGLTTKIQLINELVATDNVSKINSVHRIAVSRSVFYCIICVSHITITIGMALLTLVDHHVNVCHNVDNKPILPNEIMRNACTSAHASVCVCGNLREFMPYICNLIEKANVDEQ